MDAGVNSEAGRGLRSAPRTSPALAAGNGVPALPVEEESARFPHLTDAARAMVRFLAEHPNAPIYRNTTGHKLSADELVAARAWHDDATAASIDWRPDDATPPAWIEDVIEQGYRDVPFFRARGGRPRTFADVPTTSRADLAHDIAAFVPDPIPTDGLIHYSTSGTTGERLLVPSHPLVAARYLAFHLRALRRFDVEPRARRGEVGLVLLGFQQKCFTYVSVTPLLDESGLAKINLHPADWRSPNDRACYLNALAPEFIAGDPISFAELLRLDDLRHKPRALLCTSMALLAGLRAQLEARFACPVLDLYSMNEAGPIAVFDARRGGHVLLQHRLYVEICDRDGRALPPGERSEIVLTGGFNFCLPLLRYRTGDFASLEERDGELVLIGLEGRPPVRFRKRDGTWINNLEVTHAFARAALALPRWALHQNADASLVLRVPENARNDPSLADVLRGVFGAEQQIAIEMLPMAGEKVVQYTSDLSGHEEAQEGTKN